MRPSDDADFIAFVSASAGRLLRTAYLITGDEQAAQDVLQMALERTYRKWGHVKRADVPEAYVRRLLANAATDAWRSRRGPRTVELDEARLPPPPPDPIADGLASRDALFAVVKGLPAGQRAVLVLRYFNDLTEAQIADALGCSVGTVKSQHARAIARLRKLMPDRGAL